MASKKMFSFGSPVPATTTTKTTTRSFGSPITSSTNSASAKKEYSFGPQVTATTTSFASAKNEFSFGSPVTVPATTTATTTATSGVRETSAALQRLRDEIVLYAEKQREVGEQFEICMKEVKEVRMHLESKESVFEL